MPIDRSAFIESFARATPSLNLVFLNHSGGPDKLLTDISSIDLLADKNSSAAFITFCETHPLVRRIREFPEFMRSKFVVELNDGSQLNFTLIRTMIRKTMRCLNIEEVRKDATVNIFGMLTASNHHHFDYLILKYQFAGVQVPDRYMHHFSTFDFVQRTEIFKYMQSRYHLVFNTLEDLYKPARKTLLTLMVGLRGEPKNTLMRMFFRSVGIGLFNMFGPFTRKMRVYDAVFTKSPVSPLQKEGEPSHQAVV
jgi:hypothetical protein